MRKHRKADEWRALILAQQHSELSIADFCKQHQLSTSAFYKNRADLMFDESPPATFIAAKVTQSQSIEIQTASTPPFVLRHQHVELSLPASTSPEFIADLMSRLTQ